jgi:hypothetical protein
MARMVTTSDVVWLATLRGHLWKTHGKKRNAKPAMP